MLAVPTTGKRALAWALRRCAPLRAGLRLAVRVAVRGQRVGAVGLLRDGEGRVLVAKHVFRPRHPWGLPGGWAHRGEDPARTVARELREELGVDVEVGALLLARPEFGDADGPGGLSLVYACELRAMTTGELPELRLSWELLDARWLEPSEARTALRAFERAALDVALGHRES